MPITDAQVEAFARRFYPDHAHRLHRVVFEELRAALEAAERAAWSTDMEAAPPLERIIVSGIETFVSGVSHNERSYRWWEEGAADVNGRLIDHPTADMWRPLPLPPEARDE